MKKRNTLQPPTLESFEGHKFEYSMHKISSSLVAEYQPVCVEVPKDRIRDMLVIPTFQPCQCPVIEWTDEARIEKDRLLELFVRFSEHVVTHVRAQDPSYWGDYVDPSTGYPKVRGPSPYCEASAMECLLPYTRQVVGTAAGGCSMITHPTWGLQCYPATLFVLCPPEVAQEAIQVALKKGMEEAGAEVSG